MIRIFGVPGSGSSSRFMFYILALNEKNLILRNLLFDFLKPNKTNFLFYSFNKKNYFWNSYDKNDQVFFALTLQKMYALDLYLDPHSFSKT